MMSYANEGTGRCISKAAFGERLCQYFKTLFLLDTSEFRFGHLFASVRTNDISQLGDDVMGCEHRSPFTTRKSRELE